MKNEIKHTEFENLIKQKLDNFEFPFNNKRWDNLKKELPKKKFYSTKLFYTTVSLIIVSSILYYCLKDNNTVYSDKNVISGNISTTNNFDNNITINTKVTEIEDNKITEVKNLSIHNINNNNNNKERIVLDNDIEKHADTDNKENLGTETKDISETKNITKTNINYIPKASYKANATKGCEPFTTKFTPDEIADSIIYLWEFSDGSFSNEASPVHQFKTAGTYRVSLTVKYFHCEKQNKNSTLEINVFAKPNSDFKYKKENNIYTFQSKSKNADRYEWFINDKYFNSSSTSCEFNKECMCNVKLISYNQNGCSDTITKDINIKIDYIIYMPNAFKPNGDGRNDTFGPIISNLGNKKLYFRIVNRFGQTVFESYNINHLWDGKVNNTSQMAISGKYAWEIIIKDENNVVEHKTGYVTLQR